MDITWDDLRVLLAVSRGGSFLAAGRALGISTSTTARRIAELEGATGRRLVVKTSSGTRLEAAAAELVALAESVEVGLHESQRRAETLGGRVRVTMGEGFAAPLTPVLAAVRRKNPGLSIELMSETRFVDLARREADVGLRIGRSRSAVLVEKLLGHVRFSLYGSREYLERRSRATSLTGADLARLDFVGFAENELLPQSRWLSALGARSFGFRSNSDAVRLEAIRHGQGVGVVAELVADGDPSLQKLDVGHDGPQVPVWLAFHRELRTVERVRVVTAAIEAAVRARLGDR